MIIYVPKEEALKALPFIDDVQLFKATSMAIWLILDKGKPLKYSIDTAAKKHNVTPKVAIERLVRQAIPEEFFFGRIGATRPKAAGLTSKTAAIRGEKLKKMEKEGKKHISDIS